MASKNTFPGLVTTTSRSPIRRTSCSFGMARMLACCRFRTPPHVDVVRAARCAADGGPFDALRDPALRREHGKSRAAIRSGGVWADHGGVEPVHGHASGPRLLRRR